MTTIELPTHHHPARDNIEAIDHAHIDGHKGHMHRIAHGADVDATMARAGQYDPPKYLVRTAMGGPIMCVDVAWMESHLRYRPAARYPDNAPAAGQRWYVVAYTHLDYVEVWAS